MKLNARQLRTGAPDPEVVRSLKRNPITIILDNVLDTYNVGSIFRLADAVAARAVILCGDTPAPPNSRIRKASINTTEWVPWQYVASAGEAVAALRRLERGIRIIAVEQHSRSIPLYAMRYAFPIAVVVGNETYGVSKAVLDTADAIVELPVWGVNKSLNVMVALGIVLYDAMRSVWKSR